LAHETGAQSAQAGHLTADYLCHCETLAKLGGLGKKNISFHLKIGNTERMTNTGDRISLLTAYGIGLEGVLARLDGPTAPKVFFSAPDFMTALVRLANEAVQDGKIHAAQRVGGDAIHKHFRDGWPSLIMPAAFDLIAAREDWQKWQEGTEPALRAHLGRSEAADHLPHHLRALAEGLLVLEGHSGDTRNLRANKDDRARRQEQKFKFDFGMR
jgi:hypothetical protein